MTIGKVSQSAKISFRGYDKHLDEKGNPVHTFFYPHSDEYDLRLELLRMSGDNEPLLKVYDMPGGKVDVPGLNNLGKDTNVFYRFKLIDKSHSGKDPLYAIDNGIIKSFGTKEEDAINNSTAPFNQFFPDRKIVSKPGIMQLQVPDLYYPGVEYKGSKFVIDPVKRAKALSESRTHVGKLGGTLDGMTYMLPQKAAEGYTRIVGTPFTKDEISSHLYWTQNAYQMASSLGGLQSMRRFQKALFRNGINFVSDAALVNEGLQGIHFANVMKWGQNSPFYNWFKTYDLDSNNINLGVIPKNSPYVRMRIVNSPIDTAANPIKGAKYNPKLPTYVQIYDSRLVSKEQEAADKVFTKYDKTADNHFEITKYSDAVLPYAFPVNPDELAHNIRKYSAYSAKDFADNNTILNLLNFSKFKIGEREVGGIELWDGNVDITKLNFSYGNYDFETINKGSDYDKQKRKNAFIQGVREVQDYAVLSGKYWAKLAADTQLEYAATAFKNVKSTSDALKAIQNQKGKILPKSTGQKEIANNPKIIENVLNNKYNLFKLDNISTYTSIDNKDNRYKKTISSYHDVITKSIMNTPLETLEVADDTASIFSSGFLTKRAGTNEQIGLTRFDIYRSGYPNVPRRYQYLYKATDKVLLDGVYKFVDSVLSSYTRLDNSQKLKDDDDKATIFGKYAINTVVPDITKYAILKALNKDVNITVESDGSLNFDNIDREALGVKALEISDSTPENEAENLITKIKNGLKTLNEDNAEINKLVRAVSTRLEGLNENSFKLADMIIDRTESGIGLRVDAAKDIAAIDSVRAGKDSISKAWADTIDFWSRYVKDGIQSENPHAFSTAEVTDIDKFIVNHRVGDLESPSAADRKILEETGITSLANYTYLFSMPIGIYSYNAENGQNDGYKNISNVKSKLDCLDMPEWRDNLGMLFQGPADSSIHSYTFSGNHDKPRILHVLGLDMNLYNSFLDKVELQNAALDVLNLDEDSDYNIEEDNFSAPAIAMGKRIKDVFNAMIKLNKNEEKALKKLKEDDPDYVYENDANNMKDRIIDAADFRKITLTIAKLAQGIYQVGDDGDVIKFNPDSFGQKPFDVVLNDVIKTADLGYDAKTTKRIYDIALKKMLAPAMEKYRSIYKMLTLLPGDPTDFAGDKEGSTGFESKCKNISQQNRNAIKWEWVNKSDKKNYKSFIDDYKKSMDDITSLRKRPELGALNNGHTVSLINYTTGEELDNPEKRTFAANFRYNAGGSQVITIFGKPDLSDSLNPAKPLGDKKVSLDFLNLGTARSREGLVGGLKVGTVFVNANSKDKSEYIVEKIKVKLPTLDDGSTDPLKYSYKNYNKKKYYVDKETEMYVLKRYNSKKEPIKIEVDKNDDNALVLYKKKWN